MNKMTILYTAALLISLCLPSSATVDFLPVIEGNEWNSGPDTFYMPGDFTLWLLMTNDGDTRYGFSLPLYFFSPGGDMTNVIHRNIGGHLSTGSLIDHWSEVAVDWNVANEYLEFGWDGVLPDTFCHAAASTSGWLPDTGWLNVYEFAFRTVKVHDLPRTFCIDSAYIDPVNDWLWDDPSPDFGGPYCWEFANPPYLCGDANADAELNIFDVTYMISYLYRDGPEPLPPDAGDPNADFNFNIFDVTYLITYLYLDGPSPQCPGEER